MAEHGSYNGWCRVVGIPLKAEDCPECQAADHGLLDRVLAGELTEAQARALRILADGEWHDSSRTGAQASILGTVAAALWRQKLVDRVGESRTARPTNSGYRYRINDAGRLALGGQS